MLADVTKVNDYMMARAQIGLTAFHPSMTLGIPARISIHTKLLLALTTQISNRSILEVVVGADILVGGGKAICESIIADAQKK